MPAPYPQAFHEVVGVSQIVATGTQNPPSRVTYGYSLVDNSNGEGIVTMDTITVPSPTGTGTSQAILGYVTATGLIAAISDGNGYLHSYTFLGGNQTQVQVTTAAGTLAYVYTVGYDANLSETTVTDGNYTETQQPPAPPTYTNTTIIRDYVYADIRNPYRPSVVYDGNGYAKNGQNGKGEWQYTWDTYGHITSATTPYGTETLYTWSKANFSFGELIQW